MKKSILILSAIILCSCASRKVNTEIKKTETKSELTANVKEETTANTESNKESTESDKTTVKNDVTETEEEVIPVDNSKPVTKTVTTDGNMTKTVWENASVKSRSKTDKSTSEKETDKKEVAKETSKTNYKSELAIETKENTSTKEKSKHTEVISLWWLLLLLIPFGYWVYKKHIA